MEVILLERVAKLGQMGDVVRVKNGYGRNFLLPAGKALRATEDNRRVFERRRSELETRNLELRKEAESVAETLAGRMFTVIRSASGTGALYGSVSARDIWESASDDGVMIDRQQILLARPIKEIGIHEISVSLHPEVDVDISINVARSEEEAEKQAQTGSAVGDSEDEDDQDVEATAELAAGDDIHDADSTAEPVPGDNGQGAEVTAEAVAEPESDDGGQESDFAADASPDNEETAEEAKAE